MATLLSKARPLRARTFKKCASALARKNTFSYLLRGAGNIAEKGAENDRQVEGDRAFSGRCDRSGVDLSKWGVCDAGCATGRASACRECSYTGPLAGRLATGLGLASRLGTRLGLLPGLGTRLGTWILWIWVGRGTAFGR